MSLQHLQQHLPWTLPYSRDFYRSQGVEGHRNLVHDLLHLYKSLGKVAAVAERIDHGDRSTLSREELEQNVADLVICGLHIAKTNPAGEFDLGTVVVEKLESRNKVSIPDEVPLTPRKVCGTVNSDGTRCELPAGHWKK